MQYRDALGHLIRFYQVGDDALPTFKARIYILRKAGIPPLEKVGTGSRATYSLDDLTELHLALSMTEFGISPNRISQIMGFIRITEPWWPFTKYADADKWLLITLRASAGELKETDALQRVGILGEQGLLKEIKSPTYNQTPTWHAILDLRKIGQNLRDAVSGNQK